MRHRTPVVTSKDFECEFCGAEPGEPCTISPELPVVMDGYHMMRRDAFANHVVRRAGL